jgi:acetyl esterase/lipase
MRCLWPSALLLLTTLAAAAPAPPQQPPNGPGGADYKHGEVVAVSHGKGASQYWLFEPAAPVPKSAPVVVFLHGWGALNPDPYRAWIDHIVRRGNIVIYPAYQTDFGTPAADFTPNAMAAVTAALEVLRANASRLVPDEKRFALVGHSTGGVLCANIAARAERSGLPPVQAFMSVQPGKTRNMVRRAAMVLDDLSQVPKHTLILTVAGDRDRLARDTDARRIYIETAQVPPENKNFVVVASDSYGSPPLEAHHFSPLARAGAAAPPTSAGRQLSGARERMLERAAARGDRSPEPTRTETVDEDDLPDVGLATVTMPDALDFYGYWKLFDALSDAAFYGRNREYALGNTRQQRFMGLWSDGRPVRELTVFAQP